tara:strand:+ start:19551 stop:21749 length:2199 start_codon:yes stop_codon:yes gene_type:complete
MGSFQYAIRIEGIGDQTSSATNKLTRYTWDRAFFTTPSSSDPDSLYVSGLLRWPSELSFGVDFRRFSPKPGSQSYSLRRTSDTLTDLLGAIPATLANIKTAINATATTLVLDVGSLTGVIYAGREAISISSGGGGGGPTYSYTVVRGQLETNGAPHSNLPSEDNEVFRTMHPTTLAGRLCQLIRAPLGSTGYGDEVVLWTGTVRRISLSNPGVINLEADDVLTLLRQTKIYREPYSTQVFISGELIGRAIVPPPTDGAKIVFDSGAGATLQALAVINDRASVVTYTLDSSGAVYFLEAMGEFMGITPEPGSDTMYGVREFFSTNPVSPSNSASPAINTLPLQQHPGKLCLQLLLTTENNGVSGYNGDFDTGINALAGAIPANLIDQTSFLAWGDGSEPMDAFHIGHDDEEPINLFDLIQDRILTPRGAVMVQTSGGLLGVANLADALVCGSTNAITQSQIINTESLASSRNIEDTIDSVSITYNDRPGIGPDSLNATDSIRYKRAPRGEHENLDLGDAGTTSLTEAIRLSIRVIQFFHNPIWGYTLQCLNTADFWPGDVVQVTHDKLIASGAMGITEAQCLVLERRESLTDEAHTITLTVWNVGEAFAAVGCIGQSGRVSSWNAGTGTLTLFPNAFTESDRGPFRTDAASFSATDVCTILDQYGAVRDANVVVSSQAGNDLILTGVGISPVSGDIIQGALYTSATATQKAEWAYICDPDGTLNSDDPKDYTT